jgi:hypothetical protein
MSELLFYPILVLLLIIQLAIVRYLPLFNGTADILLLWLAAWGLQNKGKHVWIGAIFAAVLLSFASAVPWYAYFVTYLILALMSRLMNRHFWHNPLIALLFVVFFGSLLEYIIQFVVLLVQGISINFLESLKFIIVPSTFLNLLLAIPVYVIVSDMAQWVYPKGADE